MSSRKSKVLSLSLAQAVLMLVGVLSGMVFSRTLTTEDYGTYLQTFLAYDIAVPILTLGLPSALYYFLPGSPAHAQKGLVIDNLFLLLMGGIIFCGFMLLGGAQLLAQRFNNPALSKTLEWLAYYPLYTFPIVLSSVLVIKDRVNLNAIYNVGTGLLMTGALIAAALYTQSYEVPILVRIILPLLFFPISLYLSFKYVPGPWVFPKVSSMRRILVFAIPLGIATVFGTLTRQTSNMIVSLLTNPGDFAVYSNGAREIPFIAIVTGSIAVVIMAEMAQKCKSGEYDQAIQLFLKASTLSASLLLPIMIFLLVYAEHFIVLLYSDRYLESVLPFQIFLFYLPVRIIYYGSAFVALGKTKAILYRSVISLILTGSLGYVSTIWFGYIGAAVSTILISYLWAIPYNLIMLGREFGVKPLDLIPLRKIGTILCISIVCGIGSYFVLLLNLPYLIGIIVGSIVFACIYSFLSIKYLPEFKEIINPIVSSLKSYVSKT